MTEPSVWAFLLPAIQFVDALPPVVLGILVVLAIIFVIKSLIKFAIFAAAIALIVFVLWKFVL